MDHLRAGACVFSLNLTTGPLYLNGSLITPNESGFYLIPSGDHLLQFGRGKHIYSVSLESGEATLRPPIMARPDIFHHVEDPAKYDLLVTILRQLFPEGETLYLVDGDRIWEHTVGRTEFVDRWEQVVTQDRLARRRNTTAWTLIGSGTVVAVGSTALMLTGAAKAETASTNMTIANNARLAATDAETLMQANEDYDSAFGDYTRAYLLNIAGAMTAVAGGMLAGGEITLLATTNTWRIDASGTGLRVRIDLPQRG